MKKRITNIEKLKSKSYEELLASFKKDVCPVCNLGYTGINDYFINVFYESVNDPELRKVLRSTLGYCKHHSEQLIKVVEKTYNRLGASIILEDLAKESIKKLGKSLNQKFKKISFKDEKNLCPACKYQKVLEKIYIYEIANYLDDSHFYNEFIENSVLCFIHMNELIIILKDKKLSKKILEAYKTKIEKNIALIHSFIKKNDYQNKENILPEEAEAWKEAVKKIKGTIIEI